MYVPPDFLNASYVPVYDSCFNILLAKSIELLI